MVQEVEQSGIVEDCRMLALMYAVIASNADIFISGELGFHLLQLVDLSFLGPEYLKVVEKDELGDDRASLAPTVSPEGISAILVSDVERADLQGSCTAGCTATGNQCDCKRSSQHGKESCGFHYGEDLIFSESKVNKY